VVVLHASPDGHAEQVAPPAPQEAVVSLASASHMPVPVQHPAQAPPPQEQVPLVHESPDPQAPHVAPPVPHSLADCVA
jgi:hypothetical protein